MSSAADLRFFDPKSKIAVSENRLPHWQQNGAAYFVTFRLADALPRKLLEGWMAERNAWLRLHPVPWTDLVEREYHTRFTAQIEDWLDAGSGACVLKRSECAGLVAEAMRHFNESRYNQISWVIMPNHVHGLFTLNPGVALDEVIHSWKLFSARRINAAAGTKGALWQRDYFDRIIRDETHFNRCVRYIRNNPAKAKLNPGEFLLWESELARAVD